MSVPTSVSASQINSGSGIYNKTELVAVATTPIKQELTILTEAIKKYSTGYRELSTRYDVPKTKTFEIKFNGDINVASAISNIKVINSAGVESTVAISSKPTDKTIVTVQSPTGGYTEGESYALIIKKGITSTDNKGLSEETVMKFAVAEKVATENTITLNSQNEIIATYIKDINQSTFNTGNISVKDASGSKQYIEVTVINSKTVKLSASKTYPLVPGSYNLVMSNLKYKDGTAIANVNKSIKVEGAEQLTVLQAVKDFNGGRLFKETNLSFYATSGDYLKAGQWNQIKQSFNTKYSAPQYNYIKDIDHYKNMNGLTVNFDKVNNENKLPVMYNVKTGLTPEFLGLPIYPKYVLPSANYYQNMYAPVFMWRPDIEQELVLLINQERRSLGLKEVTVDADLSAISKWAAKRQHFASSYYESQRLNPGTNIFEFNVAKEYYTATAKIPTLDEMYSGKDILMDYGTDFKAWSQDITPFISGESTSYYNNYKYDATTHKKYNNVRLENEVYNLFNLSNSKKIYTVKYNSIYHNDATSLMKRFKDNPYLGYTSNKEYNPRETDRTGYFVINIMNIIKNPNITKVGIGCLYQSPTSKYNVNGMTGMYMLAQ